MFINSKEEWARKISKDWKSSFTTSPQQQRMHKLLCFPDLLAIKHKLGSSKVKTRWVLRYLQRNFSNGNRWSKSILQPMVKHNLAGGFRSMFFWGSKLNLKTREVRKLRQRSINNKDWLNRHWDPIDNFAKTIFETKKWFESWHVCKPYYWKQYFVL